MTYHVLWGLIQSNVRGPVSDFVAGDQYTGLPVDMWRFSDSTIVAASEPLSTRDTATGMGVLNTFIKDYVADRLPSGDRMLVVNLARGGTGFSLPSTNPSGSAFTWDRTQPNDANNLALTSVAVMDAILALPALAGAKHIAAIANHGSTDGTNSSTGYTPAMFKAALTDWITYLRAELALPGLPYLMMQMRPSLVAAETRHQLIDSAQQQVASELPLVRHVLSPVGATYEAGDSVHFNLAGVRDIGHRLYSAYDVAVPILPVGGIQGLSNSDLRRAFYLSQLSQIE